MAKVGPQGIPKAAPGFQLINESNRLIDNNEYEGLTTRYLFVQEQDPHSIRNHVMQEHWKNRRRTQKCRKRVSFPQRERLLLPNPQPACAPTFRLDLGKVPIGVSSMPKRPTLVRGANWDPESMESISPHYLPTQILRGTNRALSYSQVDPFQILPIHMTTEHYELLHYWLHSFATLTFEDLPVSNFNPIRDVWVSLNFSNAASLYVVMAHSAAHIAQVQGITTCMKALGFKMEALRIVTTWISDQQKAVANEAFAAVLSLLTYERYWGSEREWSAHWDGLQQMIQARGGIAILEEDWRLHLAISLVSLMSKPSWFDTSNTISKICGWPPPDLGHSHFSRLEHLHKVQCLWLMSFLQDLRIFMDSPSPRFTGIPPDQCCHVRAATELLATDFSELSTTTTNNRSCTPRLACIFFIYFVLGDTQPTHNPKMIASKLSFDRLIILDTFLCKYLQKQPWDVRDLYIALFDEFDELPEIKQQKQYIQHLTSLLFLTSSQATHDVKKCLLRVLTQIIGNDESAQGVLSS